MYRYRPNDVLKRYLACTKVVLQKTHVPKLISYVPKSSCTETVHPFVPKLSCTESDLTRMGVRLRQTNHLTISPSHPSQLSLLPSAGQEMSTSQSAVMLCGWGVTAGIVHTTCG